MPSSDGLGEQVVKFLQSMHRAAPREHSEICDGLSCDRPKLVAGRMPALNFEVWLSRLAEPQPYFWDSQNDNARAFFRELTNAIWDQMRLATVLACEQIVPSLIGFRHSFACGTNDAAT